MSSDVQVVGLFVPIDNAMGTVPLLAIPDFDSIHDFLETSHTATLNVILGDAILSVLPDPDASVVSLITMPSTTEQCSAKVPGPTGAPITLSTDFNIMVAIDVQGTTYFSVVYTVLLGGGGLITIIKCNIHHRRVLHGPINLRLVRRARRLSNGRKHRHRRYRRTRNVNRRITTCNITRTSAWKRRRNNNREPTNRTTKIRNGTRGRVQSGPEGRRHSGVSEGRGYPSKSTRRGPRRHRTRTSHRAGLRATIRSLNKGETINSKFRLVVRRLGD